MSGFNPYSDGTGYGGYNGGSSGGHLDGGFDHNGGNHGDNNDSQFGGGSQGKPNYARQFIVPVTIKMLNEATLEGGHDGNYFSHGIELSYVRFIGVIREVDTQNTTHTMYKLEDGTGTVSIRAWNNDMSDSQNGNMDVGDDDDNNDNGPGFKQPQFSTNDYVEVVATIKEFNNKLQIQTQRLAKITNFNSVPYHLLNVAKHFFVTKNASAPNSANSNDPLSKPQDSLFVSEASNGNAAKSLSDRLFDFIKQHSQTMSDGVPMQFMAHELDMSLDKVENGISELVEEGRIFSTTDDTQYLPL
ncbi:hypothetical protein PICMEDRAFT_17941 [Pichia membranifaciens NRRL Y-2026]|uniref:Replication protein A C-terminal domain-containing protein n=1 Tax=Pichia membranifaciens NRRL Y-2026 TaxID=763406 RepID=A0A1E3NH70_9ASCO|nr:hypothetical protein PICMEDRAFT_17941 [Pichia membranifaciens NRRL Y-2026]ODQ45474.1 hypothetical protein PICMEDRAFT_17941 [Pichia membranifaciens NRRL Y-2026]